MVGKRGDWYYNFWQDEQNPKGLWRRTGWESYRAGHPDWEILLDVDALGRRGGRGVGLRTAPASCARPHGEPHRRAMLALSPDGGDAEPPPRVRRREPRLRDPARRLRPSDGEGQRCPGWTPTRCWSPRTGPGSLTTSSYPRTGVKLRRGQPLAERRAALRDPGRPHDGAAWPTTPPRVSSATFAVDWIDFFNRRSYLGAARRRVGGHRCARPTSNVSSHREWLLFRPQHDWDVDGDQHPAGFAAGCGLRRLPGRRPRAAELFTPDAHTSLQSWSWTRDFLLLNLLHDVSSEIRVLDPAAWTRARASTAGCVPAAARRECLRRRRRGRAEGDDAGRLLAGRNGFPTPPTLERGTLPVRLPRRQRRWRARTKWSRPSPSFFDEAGYEVQQHFAISKDGTRVPYFQVAPAGPGPRRQQPHPALRLRRLRGLADPGLQRRRRPRLAGRRTSGRTAGSAAASTWWPTSAAAASTARAGTGRR